MCVYLLPLSAWHHLVSLGTWATKLCHKPMLWASTQEAQPMQHHAGSQETTMLRQQLTMLRIKEVCLVDSLRAHGFKVPSLRRPFLGSCGWQSDAAAAWLSWQQAVKQLRRFMSLTFLGCMMKTMMLQENLGTRAQEKASKGGRSRSNAAWQVRPLLQEPFCWYGNLEGLDRRRPCWRSSCRSRKSRGGNGHLLQSPCRGWKVKFSP